MKADQVPIPLDEHKGRGDDRAGTKHFGGPLKVTAIMVDADVVRIPDFLVVLADPVEGGRFVEERIVRGDVVSCIITKIRRWRRQGGLSAPDRKKDARVVENRRQSAVEMTDDGDLDGMVRVSDGLRNAAVARVGERVVAEVLEVEA